MKIQYYLLLLIFCCLCSCKKSKDVSLPSRQDDSLNLYFEKANNDSLPFKVRYDYAKKAENIVVSRPNDSMNRVNMFKVANRYWNMDDFKSYKILSELVMEKSKDVNDSVSIGKACIYMRDYYHKLNMFDSCYQYINDAYKIYKGKTDKLKISKILLTKALYQYQVNDLLGAEKTTFELLNYLKFINDVELKYEAFNLLGIAYAELQEFDLSEKNYELAIKIVETNQMPTEFQLKSTTLNNLGILYSHKNKHHTAIKLYQKALSEMNLKYDQPLLYAMLKDNLAYSKFKTGSAIGLECLFFESLKIRDSLNNVSGIIINKIHLSEYFAFKRDQIKSFKFAEEANNLAVQKKQKKHQLLTLEQLVNVDPKNALKYTTQYIKIRDSLEIAERKTRNKFARIEYETEELTLEKDNLISQRKTILYISSCIFFILVLILFFWYQKTKNRELVFIKAQNQANEEIYTLILDQHQKIEEGKQYEKARIAKELHDGIMGRLSSIRLNLFVLEKKTDESTIAKCIEHVHEIQEVEKEIKSIAYDLGNNLFSENISFETMVKKLFTAIENHSDIDFTLFIDPKLDWEMVNSTFKIQIYRILQEALQNIDKYAQAKTVLVSIKKLDDTIEIGITDDGVGFQKKKVKKGFGLKNMKARAKEIGGKVVVKSEKGKGTSILLIVPSKI